MPGFVRCPFYRRAARPYSLLSGKQTRKKKRKRRKKKGKEKIEKNSSALYSCYAESSLGRYISASSPCHPDLVRARNRRNVRGTAECPRNQDKYSTGVIVGKVAKREERVNRTRLKSKDRCCEQEVRGQEVRRDTEEENALESFEILAN